MSPSLQNTRPTFEPDFFSCAATTSTTWGSIFFQRAIIGAHLYTDAITTRWQTIEASEDPKPNILAFITQILGPEVHLPTEAAVIAYLEKCRSKDSAPDRSARLSQWK